MIPSHTAYVCGRACAFAVQARLRRVRTAELKAVKDATADGGWGKDEIRKMESHVSALADQTTDTIEDALAAKSDELMGR